MDAQHILAASPLDILFDGRNKTYGAYMLRKEYNKRLATAMGVTALLVAAIISLSAIKDSPKPSVYKTEFIIDNVVLPPEPQQKIVIVPPAKLASSPQINTKRFTSPPLIINDRDFRKEDAPPENNDLDKVKIGVINQMGFEDDKGLALPSGSTNGVTSGPGAIKPIEDSAFIPIEIESEYPGGTAAWKRFLIKTLQYPVTAEYNRIQGAVEVMFIVDTDGTVSDISTVSGPEELQQEAVRVVKKSGKWKPAIQNGRKVKSYKKQSIVFRLQEE